MPTNSTLPTKNKTILAPLSVLRTDTILSRYPIHQLSKADTVDISIEQKNESEGKSFSWKVGYNSLHGVPRQLAYKLDKFVINRRIADCQKPIPQILRIGTLHEIAQELNLSRHTKATKEALHQNASVFIEAHFEYVNKFGKKESLTSSDTRYGLYERGMELPNGETAEEVYLVLHDAYWRILNNVETRPLDYDYLKSLTPIGSRWYELISFKMYGSLKHKQEVKILYSEFCASAPQRRYVTYDKVKKQMYKVHIHHIKADYISNKVKFVRTLDKNGKIDWEMHYQPGEKAIEEFFAFQGKKYNRTIDKPGKGKTNVVSEATDLVKYFYGRFYNTTNITPNRKAELQALRLIEDFGVKKAQFVIDFVHQRLAKSSKEFKPDHFGFILTYKEQAISVYEEHLSEQKRQAEFEESEKQRRILELQSEAYEKFRSEALERFKREMPTAEKSQLMTDVRQQVVDEGGQSYLWDTMTRIRFDNIILDRASVPKFEVWKNSQDKNY